MDKSTDFVKLYSDLILKKIVSKIYANQNKKDKAVARAMETAETGQGVRSMRHWSSVAGNEFYYEQIQNGFRQMKELDDLIGWSEKLHQDRFTFIQKKYDAILHEYLEEHGDVLKKGAAEEWKK